MDVSSAESVVWESSEPFGVRMREDWIALKDPSVVRSGGRWHVFCTLRGRVRSHEMAYFSVERWEDMAGVEPVLLPNHGGYWCAPQVFYFTPERRWYMVCQAKDKGWDPAYRAAYATSEDVGDPDSWSALTPMEVARPAMGPGTEKDPYLDFWVICDEAWAYLFFTSDNDRMWRCRTLLADFPQGWSSAELAFEGDVFEANHVYRVVGGEYDGRYVNVIEAQRPDDRRYYKAYVADRLDGAWRPITREGVEEAGVYASAEVVGQASGRWTDSVSHGELLRLGVDERMEASWDAPFLYQGVLHKDRVGKGYGDIPWRLGLLRSVS